MSILPKDHQEHTYSKKRKVCCLLATSQTAHNVNLWGVSVKEHSRSLLEDLYVCYVIFGEGSRKHGVALHRVWHRITLWLSILIIFYLNSRRNEVELSFTWWRSNSYIARDGVGTDMRSLVWFGLCFSYCFCSIIFIEWSYFCLTPSCSQNDLVCFWYSLKLFMDTGTHYHLAF